MKLALPEILLRRPLGSGRGSPSRELLALAAILYEVEH
jgi:hypothetical protein